MQNESRYSKKIVLYRKQKKKAQEKRKKAMQKIWRDERDTRNKNRVEGVKFRSC